VLSIFDPVTVKFDPETFGSLITEPAISDPVTVKFEISDPVTVKFEISDPETVDPVTANVSPCKITDWEKTLDGLVTTISVT